MSAEQVFIFSGALLCLFFALSIDEHKKFWLATGGFMMMFVFVASAIGIIINLIERLVK